MKTEKTELPANLLRFTWQLFCKPFYCKWFSLMIFYAFIFAAVKLSFAYVLGWLADVVQITDITQQQENLAHAGMLFCGLFIFHALLDHLARHAWLKGRPPLEIEIKETLFRAVQQYPYSHTIEQKAGHLSQKVAEASNQFIVMVDDVIWRFIANIAIFLVGILMLFQHHHLTALGTLVWFVIFIAIMWVLGKKIGLLARKSAYQRAETNGHIVDSFVNFINVYLFGNKVHEKQLLEDKTNRELNKKTHELRFQRDASLVCNVFVAIYAVAAFLILRQAYLAEQISIGELIASLTVVYLVASSGISTLMITRSVSEEAGIVIEGLNKILAAPTLTEPATVQAANFEKVDIVIEDLHFAYTEKRLFVGLNLAVEHGQKIGLLGHSGAGKSTLVSLLMRFYELQAGQIKINGTDIATVSADSLREQIAVIPQDTSLFHRSLRENIRYGRLDATDEEVVAAAQQAHIHEYIESLPEGYETLVGERGVKLSGGQRQRIAIARAILKDAPILILDEATSALDTESEKLIQASLESLMQAKTVIAIAHRLSTIKSMDRLVVMEQGKIVEDGSHNELLKQDGHYAKLWQMQSGGFIGE